MTRTTFRKLLAAAGVKQGEAAARLGVARATVCRWLDGTTPISRRNAIAIRSVLESKK